MICIICLGIMEPADSLTAEAAMLKRKDLEPTGQVIWEIPTHKKVIAITFDDGPNPPYTKQILQLLRQYHAHATFFTIGYRMQQAPDIVREIIEDGHELGNHTMTHQFANRVPPQRIHREIVQGKKEIEKWQPDSPLLYRPPGGYINESVFYIAKKEGYKIILWSWHQDPHDWSDPGVSNIVNHVVHHARNGDIVLLHDGSGNR